MGIQKHSEGPVGRYEMPSDSDPFNLSKDKKGQYNG